MHFSEFGIGWNLQEFKNMSINMTRKKKDNEKGKTCLKKWSLWGDQHVHIMKVLLSWHYTMQIESEALDSLPTNQRGSSSSTMKLIQHNANPKRPYICKPHHANLNWEHMITSYHYFERMYDPFNFLKVIHNPHKHCIDSIGWSMVDTMHVLVLTSTWFNVQNVHFLIFSYDESQ